MLILFGTKDEPIPVRDLQKTCRVCGSPSCTLYRVRRRVTVYLLPVVALPERYLLICHGCRRERALDAEAGRRLAAGEEVRLCAGCGKALPEDAQFCPACGARR